MQRAHNTTRIALVFLIIVACRQTPKSESPGHVEVPTAESRDAAAAACANKSTEEERALLRDLRAAAFTESGSAAAATKLRQIAGDTASRGDFTTSQALMSCALKWLEAGRAAVPNADVPRWERERAWTQIVLVEILGELNLSTAALPLAQEALEILERAAQQPDSGVTPLSLALNRSQLADVLCEQQKPSEAQKKQSFHLYQEALRVMREADLQSRNQVLNNYARCIIQFGGQQRWTEADELLHEAIRLINKQGPDHPDLVRPLNNLAWLRLLQHLPDKALEYGRHVLRLTETRLRQEGPALGENALIALLNSLYRDEQNLYSVLAYLQMLEEQGVPIKDKDKMLSGWRALGLATVLWRKQRSFDVLAQRQKLYRASDAAPPELQRRIVKYTRSQSRLAAIAARSFSVDPRHPRDAAEAYLALSQDIQRQEQALGEALAPAVRAAWLGDEHAYSQTPESINDAIRMSLPDDAALVEFVLYKRRPFEQGAPDAPLDYPDHYQAFVLTRQGELFVRDLGPAGPINEAVSVLRGQIDNPKSDQKAVAAAARRAFEVLLRPLFKSSLGKRKRWLLSLDGMLTQIPIAVLDDGTGVIVDRFTISYLEAGRHLLRLPACIGNPQNNSGSQPACAPRGGAVILADPDYGPPIHELRADCPAPSATGSASAACIDPLPPLPGSKNEAELFKRYLPAAQMLLGKDATKRTLLKIDAPGLLLISTHGMSSVPSNVLFGARTAPAQVETIRLLVDAHGPIVDPYLRSLLALAGARTSYSQPPRRDQSAGVLSAREVLGMNLQGTQLVILSACETGLGDIRVSQGVIGHRRAFLAAGSETVVSSLWQVSDRSTEALMGCFAKHLSLGAGRADALTEAARLLRRRDAKMSHPYYWAPFIATGERRPLERFVFASGAATDPDPCQAAAGRTP